MNQDFFLPRQGSYLIILISKGKFDEFRSGSILNESNKKGSHEKKIFKNENENPLIIKLKTDCCKHCISRSQLICR